MASAGLTSVGLTSAGLTSAGLASATAGAGASAFLSVVALLSLAGAAALTSGRSVLDSTADAEGAVSASSSSVMRMTTACRLAAGGGGSLRAVTSGRDSPGNGASGPVSGWVTRWKTHPASTPEANKAISQPRRCHRGVLSRRCGRGSVSISSSDSASSHSEPGACGFSFPEDLSRAIDFLSSVPSFIVPATRSPACSIHVPDHGSSLVEPGNGLPLRRLKT
ncbi:MAG: hypothetical protein HQL56_11450 [Magnetococcales bacterium]|nr:hypothetical protein [Magnetococcales bacterium]